MIPRDRMVRPPAKKYTMYLKTRRAYPMLMKLSKEIIMSERIQSGYKYGFLRMKAASIHESK